MPVLETELQPKPKPKSQTATIIKIQYDNQEKLVTGLYSQLIGGRGKAILMTFSRLLRKLCHQSYLSYFQKVTGDLAKNNFKV